MGKNKGNKDAQVDAPQEIAAEPGFFGHVLKPGQSLVWENETEELALQLTTAALGPKVTPGRSTLIAEAKDSKIALCTLIPEKAEQWNMTHIFTPFDGPVQFHNEGVNEIHLSGLIDIQDDEDDEDGHHDHDGCDDHDHDDDSDDEGMPMDGTYSDSEDDEVMVFGGDDDEDSEDEDSEEDDEEEEEGRFEVIEERLHGEAGEKKQKKETPKKKEATPAKKDEKKETPEKESTPAKKEKEAAPAKKEAKKDTTPAKKEAKKDTTPAKKEDKKEATPSKKEDGANSKKRPASAEAVEVPKKAKTTTRVHKGVTIEEVAIGKGQPVGRGKKVSILYRGRLLNGKQFDANQNRKSPFTFRHGVGDVIKGMDIGIEGMRAGGKRTITIPSHLGYGKSGAGPSIPGNSTLIFEIELL